MTRTSTPLPALSRPRERVAAAAETAAIEEPVRAPAARRLRTGYAAAGALFALAAVVLAATLASSSSEPQDFLEAGQLAWFSVQPRDFSTSVTERGTLASRVNVEIKCEVDNLRGDGIYGAEIIWMIDNGTMVEKGDLVCELDATYHKERVDRQMLETIEARGQYTARKADLEKRIIQNATRKANAELAIKLAELRLQQYGDEQGGTYQIQLQDVLASMEESTAQLEIDDANLEGIKRLQELGYKSEGDLALARFQKLSAGIAKTRDQFRQRRLTEFSYQRSKRKLEGALASARRSLRQVEAENEASLARNKTWLKWAEIGKRWQEMRLERYERQLKNCKIYAPQSGMVAHHVDSNGWGRSWKVSEGTAVHRGQTIMTIPDLSHMQVETSVHESVVDRVKAGMRATVRVEGVANRSFAGTVKSVDVLPDPGSWISSDTRSYKTLVTIDEEVSGIKPGMTAVVEIHVDRLHDVLCVPLEALVHRGNEAWCYVSRDGEPVKTNVEVGLTDANFAEIRSGLQPGDQVLQNPEEMLEAAGPAQREIAPDQKNLDGVSLQ